MVKNAHPSEKEEFCLMRLKMLRSSALIIDKESAIIAINKAIKDVERAILE